LFDTQAWGQRAIFSVRGALRSELDDLTRRRKRDIDAFLADLRDGKKLAEISDRDAKRRRPAPTPNAPLDASGLAILNYVGRWSPTVKNAMVIDLTARVARTVGVLHRGGGDGEEAPAEGWLAHRDLKPGNFLLSYDFTNENGTLKVSDLGYVAGSTVAASLVNSAGGAVREPAVLAPGSYLFRPPEQVVPSIEIRFQIVDAKRGQIRFTDVAGVVAPQVGDFLECQEIKFCAPARDGVKPPPGPPVTFHKTKVAAVRAEGDYVTLTTEDTIHADREHGDEYFLGWVIRPSGQHTDIFALGAMLYLFASGGKNPERFFVKCLEGFARRADGNGAAAPAPSLGQLCHAALYESCFSLALSLCVDATDHLAQDLRVYLGEAQLVDYLDVCRRLRPEVADQCDDPHAAPKKKEKKEKKTWFGEAPLDVAAKIHEYLLVHRESPTVQHHLRDTNEVPIPFPIVYEAIRCMVRDRVDSYVRRGHPDTQSFMDVDCHEIAGLVERQLGRILRECPSAKPNLASYNNLGGPTGLFFLSRLCARASDGEAGTSAQAAPKRPESEVTVKQPPPAPGPRSAGERGTEAGG
jgi:serine/threonine protein kinase